MTTVDLIATAVLLAWMLQGFHTTKLIRDQGSSPIWVGFTLLMTLMLVVPLAAVWT